MNLKERDGEYIANTYNRFPVEIVSGKGSLVWDETGKRYIDMGSGIAVTSFGVADEEWIAAVTSQLSRVQHASNLYYTSPCVDLAEILCRRTGMKKVFFSNSGAEANECALKVAREYGRTKLGAEYFEIVTLKGSFHGRTITTLSATGQEHYHEKFGPMTHGFLYAEPGDAGELQNLFRDHHIAAVLVECIQGEGGVIPLDPAYAAAAEKIARENGALFMVDEVQTGNGRTGALYAYEGYGLSPDVVSTAKGLAGGLPMGATLLGEKVENVLGFGDHGSTFGGNPAAAAGAVSILSRLTPDFLLEVGKKGEYLKKAFDGAKGIRAVTGKGLMLGLLTEKPAGEVLALCREKGVLCLTAKDKLRLLPALNIPFELLEEAAEIIKEAAAS